MGIVSVWAEGRKELELGNERDVRGHLVADFVFVLFWSCFRDDEGIDQKSRTDNGGSGGGGGQAQTAGTLSSANSLLDSSQTIAAIEYKKGYVMRKCCYDANNKKSKSGMGW